MSSWCSWVIRGVISIVFLPTFMRRYRKCQFFWENTNQGLEPKTALREGTALVVTVLWKKANQDLEPKTALPVKYRPDLFNST